jgi:hypothetical protein
MPRQDARELCFLAALIQENEARALPALDGMADDQIAELDRLLEMLPGENVTVRFSPELVEETARERGLPFETGTSPETEESRHGQE